MSQEEQDLSTHVSLCHLRYQQLENRLNGVESRLTKMEADISSLKAQMQAGFGDIRLLLEQRNTSKQTQIIAATATIITGILAAFGYWLIRH